MDFTKMAGLTFQDTFLVSQATNSFKNALKSILRQDPDVVLVGEMRDLETISAALTIAETGHLTLGTLHTNSGHPQPRRAGSGHRA